ncbi:MAG: protein kinase [Polyangiaceae bacterium]
MRQVGRYKVVRRIGRGGMAEVLEAIAVGENGFERRVAIKRLLAHHESNESFARMFVDEAHIASTLDHPNIAAVLDFGVADGLPFQVLEYVDGHDAETLRQLGVKAGVPMPVEVALHVVTEVAHALDCAHTARDATGDALGVVHRDVSPRNILVSWRGAVKLADFGIAFSKGRSAEKTRAGVAKGTPPYMAPEQLLGGDVDGRTDIFALGCVLHTLLAGRSPLSHEPNMVTLMTGAPMELDPTLPPDVVALVHKATRYAKADRFENAAAMAKAVGAALHKRLDRDAKSLVLEWLARLQELESGAVKRAPRGKLDGLFEPELVLRNTDAEIRTFHSTETDLVVSRHGESAPPPAEFRTDAILAPAAMPDTVELSVSERLATLPDDGPHAPAPHAETGDRTIRKRKRGAGVAIASAAFVGFGVVLATFAVVRGLRGESAPGDGTTTTAPAIASGAPVEVPLPTVVTTSAEPVASAPAPSLPATAHPSDHDPRGTVRGSARVTTASATVATPVPASVVSPRPAGDTGTGVLVVGGAGALRAQIFVDGSPSGFAPKTLDLPAGPHEVKLVTSDGRTLGPKAVVVTSRHTRSEPLQWRVAE